ncbi:MAG: hypothetical protein DI527_22385 [Chelatococcus sp.]|nr:MAG: hypothetical protein DI527_22385 [Chelatococcus sp.]
MGQVVTIGLDIAKSVLQVHGVDAEGAVVIRQKLTPGRLLKFFDKLDRCLGSGLIAQSQKMTAAAMQMAEKKV